MILFWAICALCIVIALAFILPTLLDQKTEEAQEAEVERRNANIAVYRDQLHELARDLKNGIIAQSQYDQDREEIERRLLEDTSGAKTKSAPVLVTSDRGTAYALGLGIPLVAAIFYYNVGQPAGLTAEVPTASMTQEAPPEAGGRSQAQIEANVAALAKKLQANPNDVQGWTTLGRSYSAMERFGEAAGAYAKATELNPNDADLWTDYAFASAMANGQQVQGSAMELVERALKIDPDNAKALQLAGTGAYQAGDYKKAIGYWERVLAKVPPDSEVGKLIKSRIDDAKSKTGPGPRQP